MIIPLRQAMQLGPPAFRPAANKAVPRSAAVESAWKKTRTVTGKKWTNGHGIMLHGNVKPIPIVMVCQASVFGPHRSNWSNLWAFLMFSHPLTTQSRSFTCGWFWPSCFWNPSSADLSNCSPSWTQEPQLYIEKLSSTNFSWLVVDLPL